MWYLKLSFTNTSHIYMHCARCVSTGIIPLETHKGWRDAGTKKGLSFVKILKITDLEAWCSCKFVSKNVIRWGGGGEGGGLKEEQILYSSSSVRSSFSYQADKQP